MNLTKSRSTVQSLFILPRPNNLYMPSKGFSHLSNVGVRTGIHELSA